MIKRYLCTSMQDNTRVHKGFWRNLNVFADHIGANILVSQFTYNKGEGEESWFDPIVPLENLCDSQTPLSKTLVFCGEMNILPTANRPLSGFDSYTGTKSAIFPHAKVAMSSIASGKYSQPKFNYTTGAITPPNYINKKAGLKAEFHHCLGALLVEVDTKKDLWFCRQINADKQGNFQDLKTLVKGGLVTEYFVSAIVWGDIHVGSIDKQVDKASWYGPDSMLDVLAPDYQFFHDVLDFRSRNHHETKDPHLRFERHLSGEESVDKEVGKVRDFLYDTWREWCSSVVVDSNHDRALTRWLKETDYRNDPVNAVFFLDLQLAAYKAIKNKKPFHALEHVASLDEYMPIRFLREDESFTLHGVEFGMHGHLGVNGARGSALSLSRMGAKAIVGHTHSAAIVDGIYNTGTSSKLDMGYNRGPSSWSHTHAVLYPNGKRALITIRNGKWML